jgi:hypothetical protein
VGLCYCWIADAAGLLVLERPLLLLLLLVVMVPAEQAKEEQQLQQQQVAAILCRAQSSKITLESLEVQLRT